MATESYQRSKKELTKRGFFVGKTEQPWNKFSKVRQDFCGFADLIAFHPDQNETLAVQACTDDGGAQKHIHKLLILYAVGAWIKQPSRRLEVWAWGKRGAKGERKVWTLREIPITTEMFNKELLTSKDCAPRVRNFSDESPILR